MRKLSKEILELRAMGMSYRKIGKELNVSCGVIYYHCTKGAKQRAKEHRHKQNPLYRKIIHFTEIIEPSKRKYGNPNFRTTMRSRVRCFTMAGNKRRKYEKPTFTVDQLIEKIGDSPICYLTRQKNRS